ncbi:MAG: NAD-dependent epimerase/dehydratase family protein [Methylococcaceae bacterium]|nr:NAD-dependent epimerase/dehydratase family protein [Methylococcaceae bacterium]MCI0732967.1 NAD-dependent epimerase/dehydratase family protein [Methylococcaceae bacterium]
MSERWLGVLGATSFVGECLFPLILENRWNVLASSRRRVHQTDPRVLWFDSSNPSWATAHAGNAVEQWVCVAPIWVLPEYFDSLVSLGARRIVALSSTSRFTKGDSSDRSEQAAARRLVDGESQLQQWAEANGIEWIILRPTMIYGLGRDQNLAEVARFIRRFGLFPLFGKANGLRQPIHVQDLAKACMAALQTPAIANRAYNLSGAEILPYRDMISRVFAALGRPPRMLSVPLSVFRMAVAMLRFLPRYRNWTAAMAERMNRDLVFDHSEAARDLAFNPRAFLLSREDVSI